MESQNENVIPEFLGDLPRRNTAAYSILKVLFRYCLIFAVAFAAGMLFCRGSSASFSPDNAVFSGISGHFTDVFSGCDSCTDYFTVIISASASDIRYLLLIFAAGFTYFCSIATSAFIICRGFTIGFSLQYLLSAAASGALALPRPSAAAVLFSVTELALACFMIWLSTKSLIFGYDFRRLRGRKSQIVRSPLIYRYMLLYLTAFGLVLIINTVSCFASMLICR